MRISVDFFPNCERGILWQGAGKEEDFDCGKKNGEQAGEKAEGEYDGKPRKGSLLLGRIRAVGESAREGWGGSFIRGDLGLRGKRSLADDGRSV